MIIRRGSAAKNHRQRIAYVLPRLHLYSAVPGIQDDVSEAGRIALEALRLELDREGLLGTHGNHATHRETVRRLLSELRGASVGDGHW